MLTDMLNKSDTLATYSLPQKTILLTLATTLQNNTNLLFLDPEELVDQTGKGNKDSWEQLLRLQETQNFIKAQMQFMSQIAQRKTFSSLVEMALSGNAQAAKQVQELSGIMNQQDQNRTVVLHYVPRPKPIEEVTE
jgi:hypothetical protein